MKNSCAWTRGRTHYRDAAPAAKNIGTVSGYAAVYYDPRDSGTEYLLLEDEEGRVVERLAPGCFGATLRDDDILVLVNHSQEQYIARVSNGTCTLRADRRGLHYSAQIPGTAAGHDLATLLRRKDIIGSSFSFQVVRERYSQPASGLVVRELLQVRLTDVSPVLSPAYSSTSASLSGFSAASNDDLSVYGPLRAGRAVGTDLAIKRMRLQLAERECA